MPTPSEFSRIDFSKAPASQDAAGPEASSLDRTRPGDGSGSGSVWQFSSDQSGDPESLAADSMDAKRFRGVAKFLDEQLGNARHAGLPSATETVDAPVWGRGRVMKEITETLAVPQAGGEVVNIEITETPEPAPAVPESPEPAPVAVAPQEELRKEEQKLSQKFSNTRIETRPWPAPASEWRCDQRRESRCMGKRRIAHLKNRSPCRLGWGQGSLELDGRNCSGFFGLSI